MIGLPQNGPIPQARPAEPQSAGILGSLGGLGRSMVEQLNSPAGGNLLQSAFMSMMSSPSNNWLQNMPTIHADMQDRQMRQQAFDQQTQEYERRRQEEEHKRQLELTQGNQTAAWLKSKFGLSDDEAMAAASNPNILSHYLKQAQAGSDTRFGLNPIYGTDAEGNSVMGVLGTDGTFKPVDTGGMNLSTGVDRVDLGTHYGLLDKRSGQMVGTLPKENYQEAFDSAQGSSEGKARGEANVALPTDLARAAQTVQEIDQLISHPGISAIAGPLDQYRPSWTMGAEGRDALARFNQVKGNAFLQAFGMLKGGGAITEIEGLKAEQAMARMDRAQSEQDFVQALKDFREAVSTGMDKLRQRAGGQGSPASQPAAPRSSSSGVQWSVVE